MSLPLPIPSGGCPLHTVGEGGRREEEEGYKRNRQNRDGMRRRKKREKEGYMNRVKEMGVEKRRGEQS